MTISDKLISHHCRSGEFVNIQIPNLDNILWRRPFSVHRINPKEETFDILFSIVGRGTQALSELKAGNQIDILGPLGNHFEIPDNAEQIIIVAGGLGIAPFMLFLQKLGKRPSRLLFYGVASKNQFCLLDEFKEFQPDLYLCTDDGSQGHKGYVTDALEKYLNIHSGKNRYLYACGPTPMLKTLQTICIKHRINAWVSVENVMACGFGACMGCPVPLKNPVSENKKYVLACKDGPVFSLNEISIDARAFD
jgi:dihydroorotate dehydrogenase electron transfer subunit